MSEEQNPTEEDPVAGFIGRAWVDGIPVAGALISDEFERLSQRYQEREPGRPPAEYLDEVRRDALENAAEQALLREQADHVEVSSKRVDRALKRMVTEMGGARNFREHTASTKADEPRFKAELRTQLQLEQLLEQTAADVPAPDDEAVSAWYGEHREELAIPALFFLRFVRLTSREGHAAENASRMLNLQQQIRRGDVDFDTVFSHYHEAGLAEEVKNEPLDNATRRLGADPSGLSIEGNPHFLNLQDGQALVWIDAATPAGIPELEQVARDIRDRLWMIEKEAAIGAYVDTLRLDRNIVIEPVEGLPDDLATD